MRINEQSPYGVAGLRTWWEEREQFTPCSIHLSNRVDLIDLADENRAVDAFSGCIRSRSGGMEPVLRSPTLRCHSRESGNPVLRSIAGITGSPAFAGDDTAQ